MKKLTKTQVMLITRAFEALGCAQACLTRAAADIRATSRDAVHGFPETGSIREILVLVTEAQQNTSMAQSKLTSKIP